MILVRSRSDLQNLKDIRNGQRETCEALVCRHYRAIYRFLAYLTADKSLAEDLTQAAFASAWEKIDDYKGRASIKTWLHRIAYNKFIDSVRSQQRQNSLISKLNNPGSKVSQSSNPLNQLMADENSRLLFQAMCRLNSSLYLVIVLHYIQDLSFRQMAKVLNEPIGTVKWRTNSALKKLRKILAGRI